MPMPKTTRPADHAAGDDAQAILRQGRAAPEVTHPLGGRTTHGVGLGVLSNAPGFAPADGGCACGTVRYRVEREPMFVHCCHCTRCQRETGGPFAHHAMVEFSAMTLLQGEPEYVRVPTDSGNRHWVIRCPQCRVAMWNEHGSRRAVTRYVRLGTLDEPARFPPKAHIYGQSRQPWLQLTDPTAPVFDQYYDAAVTWPAASLARYAQAKAAKAADGADAARSVKAGRRPARRTPPG